MRLNNITAAIVACMLAQTTVSGFAKGAGKSHEPVPLDRSPRVDPGQAYDRIQEHEHERDRSQYREVTGAGLMTSQERNQFTQKMKNARTDKEREQVQREHHEEMKKRANAQGVDLVPPGQGEVYGSELMTVQERNEYRTQLRFAESDEMREQLKAKHREDMQNRAVQKRVRSGKY